MENELNSKDKQQNNSEYLKINESFIKIKTNNKYTINIEVYNKIKFQLINKKNFVQFLQYYYYIMHDKFVNLKRDIDLFRSRFQRQNSENNN